jgi:hypothetical protein
MAARIVLVVFIADLPGACDVAIQTDFPESGYYLRT